MILEWPGGMSLNGPKRNKRKSDSLLSAHYLDMFAYAIFKVRTQMGGNKRAAHLRVPESIRGARVLSRGWELLHPYPPQREARARCLSCCRTSPPRHFSPYDASHQARHKRIVWRIMGETARIIVSVGGSLIAPDSIDTSFLRDFTRLIHEEVRKGRRFVLIAGGGKTARHYQEAAAEITELAPDDLDWLGIHATRLNGHLLRTVLRDVAHPVIITNPDEVADVPREAPVIVAAGYRPGASTDLRAVQIARTAGARTLVNLSNIDFVYRTDPRTDPQAEPLKEISWSDFRALLPASWTPGLSAPFDPVAAQAAEMSGMEVAVLHGRHLEELAHYLDHEPFRGTRIYSTN